MYRMRSAVNVNSKAPAFKGIDIRGTEFNTATYTGRGNLVIFFYRNSRCQTCKEELKNLADKYGYITRQDGEVVAISTDSIDEVKNLAVDLQLQYKAISDPEHRILDLYGVFDSTTDTVSPALFLVDKNGIVRYRKIIEGLDDLVSGDEVVNRLRAMKPGMALHGGFNPMPSQ